MANMRFVLSVAAGLALVALVALPRLWPGPGEVPAAAAAREIRVDDSAALARAIAAADPGSTIRLAPGDYATLKIDREVDGAPIRITGPRTARIRQINFRPGAGNWRLDGVTLQAAGPRVAGLFVQGAHHITVSDVSIVGSPEAWAMKLESGYGVIIRNAEAVVVAGSEMKELRVLVGLIDSRGVVLEGNRLITSREGINVSNVHGLAVRHNEMSGFRPRFDLGEHPDFVQFWTRLTPTGSSKVEVIGNFLSAGGKQPVQGVFARAEDYENGKSPRGWHRDFVVRQNVYYGAARNGLSFSDVRGLLIENNTVMASPHAFTTVKGPRDPTGETFGGLTPAIVTRHSSYGIVRNNVVTLLQLIGDKEKSTITNNFENKPRVPADARNPGNIFAGPLVEPVLPLSAFAIRPGSEAGRKGMGADITKVGPAAASRVIAALAREADALAKATEAEAAGLKIQKSFMDKVRARMGAT